MIEGIWGRQNATVSDLLIIKNFIKKYKADVWCEAEMLKLVEKAKKYVKLMTRDKKLEKVLLEMADFMINRNK